MCRWVGSHAPSCGRQLWGLPSCMEYLSPQGVLLPRLYGTTFSPMWLELRGPAAWQAAPSSPVCRHACHQLLPWHRATFAMVPDAAWPGSDQCLWSTAPATGPVGRLGRPSASNPGGVHHCVLSLCCPRCMCMCSVLAHLAPVHRCAPCVRFGCDVGRCVPPSPPPEFSFVLVFLALYLVCFVLLFFFENGKRGRVHTAGTGMGNWCSGVIVMFCGVRRWCSVGGRTPGVRLACLDVHRYGSGWVWLVASLLLLLVG